MLVTCECLHSAEEHTPTGGCLHCKWCEHFTPEEPRRRRRARAEPVGEIPPSTPGMPERLRTRLRVNARACWEWTGPTVKGGYGRLRHAGRLEIASRATWLWVNGPIASDLQVCHRCDNPPCCNPAHLFLGTAKENAEDSVQKGRAGRRDPFRKRQAKQLGYRSTKTLGYHARKGRTFEALLANPRCPSGRMKPRCSKCGELNHFRNNCKAA